MVGSPGPGDPSQQRLLLQPAPVRAPSVPLRDIRRPSPRLSGWALLVFAFLIEHLGFLRRLVWRNAGFGCLSTIKQYLDVEPRFDPTVIPFPPGPEPHRRGPAVSTEAPISTAGHPEAGPLVRFSVAYYRSLYTSRELTPTAVANAILPLIRRDISPPGKHATAWVDVRPELVTRAAEESTLRYREGRPLGPLDGIPVAVKDEFDVQGYVTRIGSAVVPVDEELAENVCDSWCIQKLKEAGAIIMGKVTMVEFGMDTSGCNPTFGTPLNPYNEQYYTGGSSSGTAYAVSSGLVPIALGSDAGGSIRIPSSFCSVVGLKPTHGRLSFKPGINHVSTCTVKGPVAADIDSLAAAYTVISQPHPTSSFPKTYPISLQDNASRPRLIGVPETWFRRASPAIQKLCRDILDQLAARRNYTIVPIEIPFTQEGQKAASVTILTDASTVVPEHPGISAPIRILLALGRTTPSTDLVLAQKLRQVLMQHLAWLWREHPGMVIVTPTTRCAGWPIRSPVELRHGISDGDRTQDCMEYTWLANFCGVPSISMPAGYTVPEGRADAGDIADEKTKGRIPVGIMATGEWAGEETLLRFAKDVEDVCRQYRPPNWVDVTELAKEEMGKGDGKESELAQGAHTS